MIQIPVTPPNSTYRNSQTEQQAKNEPVESWQNRTVFIIAAAAATLASIVLIAEVAYLIHENIHDRIWRPNPNELEKSISNRFSADFILKIKNLSMQGIDYIRLFKRLALSNQDEAEIMTYLEENFEISTVQLKEILLGAHIRLNDGGLAYTKWSEKVVNKQSRISSHPSNTTQFGVRGALVKELLFSQTKETDGNTYTWFQLENHPVSLGHIVRHMIDYFKYRMTNKNQGPYGSSAATDCSPILLKCKN